MKATIIYHHSKEDPNCEQDYYDIELFLNGKLVRKYGEGERKTLEGFMDGIVYTTGHDYMYDEKHVADREET